MPKGFNGDCWQVQVVEGVEGCDQGKPKDKGVQKGHGAKFPASARGTKQVPNNVSAICDVRNAWALSISLSTRSCVL